MGISERYKQDPARAFDIMFYIPSKQPRSFSNAV